MSNSFIRFISHDIDDVIATLPTLARVDLEALHRAIQCFIEESGVDPHEQVRTCGNPTSLSVLLAKSREYSAAVLAMQAENTTITDSAAKGLIRNLNTFAMDCDDVALHFQDRENGERLKAATDMAIRSMGALVGSMAAFEAGQRAALQRRTERLKGR